MFNKKMQYVIKSVPTDDKQALEDLLNEMSNEGWDLYTMHEIETENSIDFNCIFMREVQSEINEVLVVAHDALWLSEKFGDGIYTDVAGLCKIATRAEIAEKNYSLTPGAYVGVAEVQEEDENFAERMKEIHAELNKLQSESNALMATINANLKELGLEA